MATVTHLGLFPDICISDEPLNFPNTPDFYVPMELSAVMAVYWKIKRLRIKGTSRSPNYETDPPSENVYIFEGISDGSGFDNEYPINSEKDLICGRDPNRWVVSDPETSAIYFSTFISDFAEYEGIAGLKRSGNTYYPFLTISWGDKDLYTYPEEVGDSVVGISTLDLKYHGTYNMNTYTAGQGVFSGGFEIEVIEFWGYDPNDGGGPIYDSSTGARIRFDV